MPQSVGGLYIHTDGEDAPPSAFVPTVITRCWLMESGA